MTTPPTGPDVPPKTPRRLEAVPNPPAIDPEPVPKPPDGNRSLLLRFGAACAALLVVLVGLAVYGFLIKENADVQLSLPGSDEIEAPQDEPDGLGDPSETPAAAPTTNAPPIPGATDGPLSFTVDGVEIGPKVVMSDAPLEKTADGVFIVVHMTVANVGTGPASFVGSFQKLQASGAIYPLADEATAYLGGTAATLDPGATTVVSIAFDVPPGSVPEFIELHGEPGGPGIQAPLP
ncbi:MAG: DUF4352 domain-containing protein [Mycobacteriaceae bacterium]|nr:DUF4352 domain-containing protein [Mycobacteriaceae bacterium]